MANTSDAMKSIGVEDKVITMDSSKLIKILSKHEGMTDDVIKRIPNVIHDPMLIVESKTNPSRIVMMGELTDAKGKTVLAVLELNPTSRKGIALDEIKIASTYGKDNLQSFVDTSKILYVNPNKQKTSSWTTSTGLQLPVESLTTGSTNSIPQNEGNASEYKENVPVQQAYSPDELPAWDDIAKRQPEEGIYAPVQENFPVKKATTVKERNAKKLQSLKIQLQNEQVHMEQAHANFNAELRELQAEYDSKKNKNTKLAQTLLARMERRKTLRDSADADYEKRISDLKDKIDKMSSEKFKTAEQRQAKEEELQSWARELMGDTSTWKDKKWGLLYKINTLHRNLRDIVRGKDGKSDIDRADAIYDALQGTYNHNQAEKNRESNAIKESYAKKKITSAEDAYIQMLGEYKYNPDSTITDEALTEYYEKHKRKININKVIFR